MYCRSFLPQRKDWMWQVKNRHKLIWYARGERLRKKLTLQLILGLNKRGKAKQDRIKIKLQPGLDDAAWYTVKNLGSRHLWLLYPFQLSISHGSLQEVRHPGSCELFDTVLGSCNWPVLLISTACLAICYLLSHFPLRDINPVIPLVCFLQLLQAGRGCRPYLLGIICSLTILEFCDSLAGLKK